MVAKLLAVVIREPVFASFRSEGTRMNTQSEQLLRSALTLPESERAEIAASLIHSLDPKPDEGVDEAWAEEIRRRIESIESGKVKLIPWEDVLAEMKQRAHG